MSSVSKKREYLRTQPTERLPKLLTIYAQDQEAVKLIEKEIQKRQQLSA
ncbi:hypothetical protein [Hymenobacter sp. YC55]|nr:hypothetical protein [Hymenobacter sp. YC55]MDF7810775.1 hypothetical protein [Hymenobacter sp. YC55]